jgi:ABC-type sugar transport system permease subunit
MLFVLYNDTISVRLWIAWFEDAMPSYASAIAVLLMLMSGGITYFIARWTLLGEKYGKGHITKEY